MPCGLLPSRCFLTRDLKEADEGVALKSPVLRRGDTSLIRVGVDQKGVDQTGTGCSMMPVGTSANITEDR